MLLPATKPPSHPAPQAAPKTWILVVQGARAQSFPLSPATELVIGPGGPPIGLSDAGSRTRPPLLTLRALEEGRIEVTPGPQGRVFLNDVQLTSRSYARAGDWLTAGESALLLTCVTPASPPHEPLQDFDSLERRLHEEVARAERLSRPLTLRVLRVGLPSGAFEETVQKVQGLLGPESGIVGAIAPGVLGVLLPETSLARAESLYGGLRSLLDRRSQPLKEGWATLHEDGTDGHALLGRALDRLLGEEDSELFEEPLRVDPVMERLHTLAERFAAVEGLVVLRGEAHVGKESFARFLHAQRGKGPFIHVSAHECGATRFRAALERAEGGTLYLRNGPALDPALLASLPRVKQRVMLAAPLDFACDAPVSLVIPPLRDRPEEILPLAESFLSRAGRRLGRPRLSLTPAVRPMLAQDRWPGNVRELKTAMLRAALLAEGSEVRPEHLPPRLLRDCPRKAHEGGLRATMKATEKSTMLETLSRTSWNVTAASKALGLPRRTVVYRMARLGLRRPERPGSK